MPGVTVVLSGASSMEQMKENLRIFAEDRPLADDEQARLMRAADEIMKAGAETAPCTACHYCVSHCPRGLDIPWLLELYNEHIKGALSRRWRFSPETKTPPAAHCGSPRQKQKKISKFLRLINAEIKKKKNRKKEPSKIPPPARIFPQKIFNYT